MPQESPTTAADAVNTLAQTVVHLTQELQQARKELSEANNKIAGLEKSQGTSSFLETPGGPGAPSSASGRSTDESISLTKQVAKVFVRGISPLVVAQNTTVDKVGGSHVGGYYSPFKWVHWGMLSKNKKAISDYVRDFLLGDDPEQAEIDVFNVLYTEKLERALIPGQAARVQIGCHQQTSCDVGCREW